MLEKQFLKAVEKMQYGQFAIVMPDGRRFAFSGPQPGASAELTITDPRAIRAFALHGDIGFAQSYRDGWWEADDLTQLLLLGLQNEAAMNRFIHGSWLSRMVSQFCYFFSRNTLSGSKRNIHAHYDLGNAFYSLWLDPTMTYSAAIFDTEDQDLVSAQHNKYDRIIDRLAGSSGSLLEIGCGWGGFAERALQRGDYGIKGLTLSNEQHDYARQRLSDNAAIALQDYRHEKQQYDHIVSIEMFEAVGEKYWPTYFNQLKACLKQKGRAVIQTITIDDAHFEEYRKSGDFIRSYIFPGGMLPSMSRFQEVAQEAGLQLQDHFEFGQGYAKTLELWLQQFDAKIEEVKALGFDSAFIRLWRFYLAACIASFTTGRTDVMQVELAHA